MPRWVNWYKHTGKRVGFGKQRRVFKRAMPYECRPGPGLDKTRNGRGFHCKDNPYQARRRRTPQPMATAAPLYPLVAGEEEDDE